jgi:phosphatidylglycerol:prolipoprotein diacylglycerol transferase
MHQILFRLPLPPNPWLAQIPIYGFGFMLVVALFLCVWVTGRRARKEGIAPETIQDLAFWIVIGGILGARIVYMVQYHQPIGTFFKFWEGGLVWYGALLGGIAGYLGAYAFYLRKQKISSWKLADVIAPSVALGLCLGRVGCLLNGCCYGGVCAEPAVPSLRFPMHSFSWGPLVHEGYQTAAGFTLAPGADNGAVVDEVDATSDAAHAGLRAGDVIVNAGDRPILNYADMRNLLIDSSQGGHGPTDLKLTVERDGKQVVLPAFQPRTLGLYPTQVFESISMILLFLLLTAYFPFRRRDGEVLLLFLTLYPIHRFLNETLRNDTDPVALGMTLSENGSLLILAAALVLWVWVLRKPVQYHPFAEKKTAAVAAA